MFVFVRRSPIKTSNCDQQLLTLNRSSPEPRNHALRYTSEGSFLYNAPSLLTTGDGYRSFLYGFASIRRRLHRSMVGRPFVAREQSVPVSRRSGVGDERTATRVTNPGCVWRMDSSQVQVDTMVSKRAGNTMEPGIWQSNGLHRPRSPRATRDHVGRRSRRPSLSRPSNQLRHSDYLPTLLWGSPDMGGGRIRRELDPHRLLLVESRDNRRTGHSAQRQGIAGKTMP